MSSDVFSVEVIGVNFSGALQSLDDVVEVDAAADVERRRRFLDGAQRSDALNVDVSVVGAIFVVDT